MIKRPFKRATLPQAILIGCLGSIVTIGNTAFADPTEQSQQISQTNYYNISAGSLDQVLNRFAASSGILLAIDGSLTSGLTSSGLQGNYSLDSGLNAILSGSGLQAVSQGNGRYVLTKMQSQPKEDSVNLPVVKVSAESITSAGLPETYKGGQVARGGRLGVLGNTDIKDAPFNITAYTSELIKTQEARSVADLLVNNDASVRIMGGRGDINEDYTIRGFYVSSTDIAFNGLYGLMPYWKVPIEFVERIELLRGPTSMLSGMPPSGGVGGTINVVPKRAAHEPLTRLSVDYTSDSQIGTHLDLGRRFGPDNAFGARINAVYREGDTAVDNQSREFPMASLALDYQGEKLTLEADLLAQKEHLNGVARPVLLLPGTQIPDVPDTDKLFGMKNSYSDQEMFSLITRAEYAWNDQIDLYATLGGRQSDWDTKAANIFIADSSNGDMFNASARQRAERRTYSGEAGLRARFETGSFGHEVTASVTRYDHQEGLVYLFAPNIPGNLYQPPINIDLDASSLDGSIPTTTESVLSGLSLTDQISMFDERLNLTLGIRRQWIDAQNYDQNTGVKTADYADQVWTPLAGISFAITSNLSIYANAIEGLSQGDTAPITASNPGEMLSPYKTQQYEIGMKYEGINYGASWAAFQIEKPNAFTDSSNTFRDDGEQRNRGLEFNVYGELSDGFRVLGGLSYIQPEQLKTENGANDGNDARGVARRQANLGVYWDVPTIAGASLNARWIYTGEAYLDQQNSLKIPSWQRYDIGGSYGFQVAGKTARININVENLFGEDYWQGASFYDGLTVSSPRTYTISATVDF